MKIAVFGAAFDPPHCGHRQIAEYVIDQKLADEVWFLPVKLHHFGKQLAGAEHRLAMVELLIKSHEHIFKIKTYELDIPVKTHNKTYLTLTHFKETFPEHTFSFVIGTDNLARFHEWDYYEALASEFTFLVYPRLGFKFEPLYPGMKALSSAPIISVSSTEVRDKVRSHQAITGLVTPAVEQYIKTHHLYVT